MAEFINLIPEQEVNTQKREKAVKMSSVLAVLILLLVLAGAGYFFYINSQLQNTLKDTEAQITSLRGQIVALSDTEITARNLFKKYTSLQDIYGKRNRYSAVLEEFNKRKTEGVKVDDFAIDSKGIITISGSGDNYLLVAKFMKDLTDKDFSQASMDYKELFTAVTLNTVNLSNAENRASFSLSVTYNPELLKK